MKKRLLITALIIVIICLASYLAYDYYRHNKTDIELKYSDIIHNNPAVESEEAMLQILDSLEKVSIDELPESYLEETGMNKPEYACLVKEMEFYVLRKKDTYRNIVGNYRILEFMSKDKRFYKAGLNSETKLYWGLQKEILLKLMELRTTLKKKGYKYNAIKIRYGHRTPELNETIGGAKHSRHIAGEAIDLHIMDIDNNGIYEQADKKIVLELCENEIIGNEGGVGRYPGSPVVHIDVRGYKARWNHQKKK